MSDGKVDGWSADEVKRLAVAHPEMVNIHRDAKGNVVEVVPTVTREEYLQLAACYPTMWDDSRFAPTGNTELDVLVARYPSMFKRRG